MFKLDVITPKGIYLQTELNRLHYQVRMDNGLF